MKKILLLFLIVSVLISCKPKKATAGDVVETSFLADEIIRVQENSEESLNKPYVILVSIDGFRYDYAEGYEAKNLLNFDVSAEKMIPSFPTKTFPNHYTLVTGLYPGNNGLVSNSFYDRSKDEFYEIRNRTVVRDKDYYNGTPLWVLASQQEMVTASMFWIGSEAPIKDTRPTYYFNYDGSVTDKQSVNKTINWLKLPEEKRPHFITLYFSITDDVGHTYGPNSKEIEDAVKSIDTTIGYLVEQTEKLDLPINIIVVSDHGMIEVERTDVIDLSAIIPDTTKVSTSFPYMVYSKDSMLVDEIYSELKKDSVRLDVYLRAETPTHYHYNKNDDSVGDLIIMPKAPYTFGTQPKKAGSSTHGYDPTTTPEMGAVFYAKGDAFKKDIKIDSFENVAIYPLVSEILQLDYSDLKIDGKLDSLKAVLK